ncbi:MAG: PKD domain-containing protein [Bacteroidetes bacterium]|nr:PKD domain-containing protein [Bacteroidota bacterium]
MKTNRPVFGLPILAPSQIPALLTLFLMVFGGAKAEAQTVEFSDGFESGSAAWILTGGYGISSTFSYAGTSSLTESPVGFYGDGITATATMVSGADLTGALDANLSFWAIYSIEAGFDYTYVEVSGDGGPWVLLDAFDGEGLLSPWVQYTYSLGAFAGNSDVKIRFRFVSDGAVNFDGMYVDDLQITSSSTDLAAPLILHDGPLLYEGSPGDFLVSANLLDPSGIASSTLAYTVDGGPPVVVSGSAVTGTEWGYTIPEQAAGSWVSYTLSATDASAAANSGTSAAYNYIAGNYIAYDNSVIDFVNSFGPSGLSGSNFAAVRISLPGTSDLATVLLRNYTDPTRPNNDILVHVWDDAGGIPGTDLITPFSVTPEASLGAPNQMTRVDLRAYSAALSGLSGDLWIGFEVPVGQAWVSQTTPGIAGRTAIQAGGIWTLISDDYHFRAITTLPLGAPAASFSIDASSDPEVSFTDLSSNSPTGWAWTFGDGGTSADQNPVYTYTANGTFSVCLTASNGTGSDTKCQSLVVTGVVVAPVADFAAVVVLDTVRFSDLSSNGPTSWAWTFGDGAGSTLQNPSHVYDTLGTYPVCLIASNAAGSSASYCQDVVITELPSGLSSTVAQPVQLFPNPASTAVNVMLGAPLVEMGFGLLSSLDGRIHQRFTVPAGQREFALQIQNLHSGVYLLELNAGKERWSGKLQIGR